MKTDNAKVDASSVEVKGNSVNIDSSSVEIKGSSVTVTGGTLKAKGQSSTDLQGPFNPIKVCPFSGAPHCGSTVAGT